MQGTVCGRRSMLGLVVVLAVGVLSMLFPGSAAASGNSKLSVVVTGNDYQVYSRTYFLGSSWGNWIPEGQPPPGIQGGPAIVYRTYESYIIFARGGDNALWYKVAGGGWYSIGKPNGVNLASDPDATSWGDGSAAVFVTAADGLVYYADFTQGINPTWRGIGSPLGNATSGPSVVSRYDTNGLTLRVFVRDQAGALRSLFYVGGGWQQGDWNNHGGYILAGTSPDTTIWDYLHMDAFVIGGDRLLYEKTFDAGSWGDWRSLSGGVIGGPGAAALGSQIDLFVRGNDNALYQETCRPRSGEIITCQEEGGSQWDYLGGGLKSDPDADWTQL
jgi:hypothetical protein